MCEIHISSRKTISPALCARPCARNFTQVTRAFNFQSFGRWPRQGADRRLSPRLAISRLYLTPPHPARYPINLFDTPLVRA